MANGALELASSEVKFELDSETQDPTDVAEYQQRETNKLIEEMMLLANQAVAKKILDSFPMFGVLRRHPPPKEEALKNLKKLVDKHGFDFKFDSNKELGQSLAACSKPDDPYFNTLVRTMTTRCMNQAIYFCTGEVQPALYNHYGLAMDLYAFHVSHSAVRRCFGASVAHGCTGLGAASRAAAGQGRHLRAVRQNQC